MRELGRKFVHRLSLLPAGPLHRLFDSDLLEEVGPQPPLIRALTNRHREAWPHEQAVTLDSLE